MKNLQSAKFSMAGVVLGFLGAAGIVTAQNARDASVRVSRAVHQATKSAPSALLPRQIVQKEPAAAVDEAVPDNAKKDAPDRIAADSFRYAFDVGIASDGMLIGRLLTVVPGSRNLHPAQKASIRFKRDGSTVSSVRPGFGGVFQADGVSPGVYSMVANGKDGLVAIGIRVNGASGADGDAVANPVPDVDAFTTILVPASDVPVVIELIRSHAPLPQFHQVYDGRRASWGENPAYLVFSRGTRAHPGTPQRSPLPSVFSSIVDVKAADANGAPAADAAELTKTQFRQNRAILTADGHLTGRVQTLDSRTTLPTPVSGGKVFIVLNGRTFTEGAINAQGMFDVQGVAAGPVSIVAVTPEGCAACTIVLENETRKDVKLTETGAVKTVSAPRVTAVAANGVPAAPSLNLAAVPYSAVLEFLTPVEEGMPMPAGGMMGGGMGGGPGLGWLGLAGLAGLAGLGNNGGGTTIIASPAHP